MDFYFMADGIGSPHHFTIALLGHIPSQMGQTPVKTLGFSMILFLDQKGRSTAGILFADFVHHGSQGLRNDESLGVSERSDRESLDEGLYSLI